MDRLRCLQVFSEVARCGSFLRAATQLSLSRATITKHVAWLEASMGAQLLKRTSKQVALTEAGARVLASGRELLERYDAIESEVRDAVHLPRGAIRVGTPPSFGAYHLMRLMAEFTRRYPDIEVTVVHDDGRSDLVAEALDLSIRIAASLEDASYVAQPLLVSPQVVVAAPSYLRAHGRPAKATDLVHHNCLVHTVKSGAGVWRFEALCGRRCACAAPCAPTSAMRSSRRRCRARAFRCTRTTWCPRSCVRARSKRCCPAACPRRW
jgi:DNA-binding transcriptional LysR family regulator